MPEADQTHGDNLQAETDEVRAAFAETCPDRIQEAEGILGLPSSRPVTKGELDAAIAAMNRRFYELEKSLTDQIKEMF